MKLMLEAEMSACPKFVEALLDNTVTSQIYHALTWQRWCKARDIHADLATQACQVLSLDKSDPNNSISISDDEAGWILVRLREQHHEIYNDYYDWFAHYAIIAPATPDTLQMFYNIGWVPA